MPRVSVVVPIYNVEQYLAECLESLAAQTMSDLEVVMVNDGSTDGSEAIAREFAARDERFRLVVQPNGGLSNARNNGTAVARGEFLAFVDSDDVVSDRAYELLLGALTESGSDFATGNVHRLSRTGTSQTQMHAQAFTKTRLATHVTRYRPLLADRTAWNKLWRRSFWDAQGFRFPEGRLHEDIPVTLPGHFAARSVDVIADPIYFWRVREGGDLSITQRRLEKGMLLDRLTAVQEVVDYLDRSGPRNGKRWYLESVVKDDLRYHLNVLDGADEDYIELFMDRVNAFLDDAGDRIFEPLPALSRLKWHLVRRRLAPELLEVLRFQKEEMRDTPPVRIGDDWYGDYPFREDARLRIPRDVYKLNDELPLDARIDDVSLDGSVLRVRGHAYIERIGAPAPDTQRVTVTALRRGRLTRVRLQATGVRLKTGAIERPDLTADGGERLAELRWAGFEATLDLNDLRRLGRWRTGVWELYVTARAGNVKRRRSKFTFDPARPLQALDILGLEGAEMRAGPALGGNVVLDVRESWARVRSGRLADGKAVELAGDSDPAPSAAAKLRIVRRDDEHTVSGALGAVGDAGFSARVPLGKLAGARPLPEPPEDGAAWELHATGDGARRVLALAEDGECAWETDAGGVALHRSHHGDAWLIQREPRAVITSSRWTHDGALELAGYAPTGGPPSEVALVARDHDERYAFPARPGDAGAGAFTARLEPRRTSGDGLPLGEGQWEIWTGEPGEAATPATIAVGLYAELPLANLVERKQVALGMTRARRAVLHVKRDLDDDERGPYHERRLRRTAYRAQRDEPLRDAVVYTSFGGRRYADSPRAIHEELVRRGAPVEHLWVVRDAGFRVPAGATALREGSREHHEALARARHVVSNDRFPEWFERRPDQVVLQTWAGTALRRHGEGVAARARMRQAERRWRQQVANWQYVATPSGAWTSTLRERYAVDGEILETGYPRNDALARLDRDEARRGLTERLALDPARRLVLYAPTYRDHVVGRHGRFLLDLQLDLERVREAVGADTTLLFRAHPNVADRLGDSRDGFVRDVSGDPDPAALLLAADALVTDYSSLMFDFVSTGRPMLFFAYDLDFQLETAGLHLDLATEAPGPLLHTSDAVAEALSDLDAVAADHAERYEAFRTRYCGLDDGQATSRVVDAVFSDVAAASRA